MADKNGQRAESPALRCAACKGSEDVQRWSPIPDDIEFPTCAPCRRFYAEWLPATTDAISAAIEKLRDEQAKKEENREEREGG